MVTLQRGDVVLVNLNPAKGSEQKGTRPALIVQNNIYNIYSPTTIISPVTSKIYEKEYPTNVAIKAEESGLPKDSTIICNQIRTIDKSMILNKISSLNVETMGKVELAIKIALGLELPY